MFNYESLKVVILGKNVCPPIVPSKSFTWNRKDGSLWTEILVFSKCDKCSIDYWLVATLKFLVIYQIDTNVKNGDYRLINYGLHYFVLLCMSSLQDFQLLKYRNEYELLKVILTIFLFLGESFCFHYWMCSFQVFNETKNSLKTIWLNLVDVILRFCTIRGS